MGWLRELVLEVRDEFMMVYDDLDDESKDPSTRPPSGTWHCHAFQKGKTITQPSHSPLDNSIPTKDVLIPEPTATDHDANQIECMAVI
jgi:hypothetical protein